MRSAWTTSTSRRPSNVRLGTGGRAREVRRSGAPAPCADDKFRDRFLWARRPMLAAVAARLTKESGNVWVDLGGGTGVRPRCRAR